MKAPVVVAFVAASVVALGSFIAVSRIIIITFIACWGSSTSLNLCP